MRTNSGSDFQALVLAGASNGTGTSAPANYMLLAPTKTIAAADTTVTGEYAAASGGLNRAAGTYAHTAGTATLTLSHTWTMNSNDGTTQTPGTVGIINAASAGTLFLETAIPNPPTMVPGDSLTVTETLTY